MSDDGVAQWRELLGSDGVLTGAGVRAFAADGVLPQCVLFPARVEELSRCVAAAGDRGLAIMPVGNGTQLGLGLPPRQYDLALSTRRLCSVLAHEASDMTVTVQAGTTLAELNAALAPAEQRLPLDPPHPDRLTIGALIATDASGPLRLSQGKVRDLLIGIKVVLADGTLVSGGGRVVKNVAGYDLMKLFTGSWGTLGTIVEATFKVRPCPEVEAAFVVAADGGGDAIACATALLSAPLVPLYLEALNHTAATALECGLDGSAVVIGCGGSAAEIEVQRARLTAAVGRRQVHTFAGADAVRLSAALRDDPARGTCGCKMSLLPSRLAPTLVRIEAEADRRSMPLAWLSHVGSGVACIRFSEAGEDSLPSFAQWLRALVREARGWVVFDVLPASLKTTIDPWGDDVPGIELMKGIKATLDPHGRLSPGRFVGGI
jgi:glycolate oxidase FAD binding subunit